MKVTKLDTAPIARKVEGFEGRRLAEGDPATVVHIRMEAGAVMEPHPAPADTAFYIIEGTAAVTSDGESVRAEKETLIQAEKGSVNGFRNDGDGPLVILVIRCRP